MRFKLKGPEVLRSLEPLEIGKIVVAMVHDAVTDVPKERIVRIVRAATFNEYEKSVRKRGNKGPLDGLEDAYFYEVKPYGPAPAARLLSRLFSQKGGS